MAVSEFARLSVFLLVTILFIVLMGMDIAKAFKKGAHWVPGYALVFSALTIQIMNFVEDQSNHAFFSQSSDSSRALEDEASKNNFIMIHSSRVMLCVLVALFLPGMARARYEEKWTKIGALGLTVFTDIFSELLTLYRRFPASFKGGRFPSGMNGVSWVSFLVSDVIISMSLVWLILLLICATRASKSIRDITTQRIPFILAEPHRAEPHIADYWKGVEDQVLKSWIVVCVCSPQSIIAKSVLASSAAPVVTICIISSIVGWIVRGPIITIPADAKSWLKLIITMLDVVFILIGWVVIGWRSLTSVRYYGRWREKSWSAWLNQFLVEDFWTGHIQEELREEESKDHFRIELFWRKHVEAKESKRKLKDVGNLLSKVIPAIEKRKYLLKCVLFLQFIVVFFSKVSWMVIEVTFYNGVVRKIASMVVRFYNGVIRKIASVVLTEQNEEVRSHFEDEYEAILKNVTVVGETPESVLATNRKALKQATKLSGDGYKDGKELDCNKLISFLKGSTSSQLHRGKMLPPVRVGVRGWLDQRTAAEDETDLKFLCKREPVNTLEEEKFFLYMKEGSWSWKLTAVSLINIIVSLSPPCGRDSFEAYFEAWQLMDLVDEWDSETDSMLSNVADREFNALVDRIRHIDPHEKCPDTIPMDKVAAEITGLAETKWKALEKESEKLAGNRRNELAEHEKIHNEKSTPVDWEKLAGAIALYKLCKGMDFSSGNFTELKNELESSLQQIIIACIQKVGTALVDNCRKWAEDLDEEKEEKLLQAIYIAGKSRGLVEALGWNPHIDPITEGSSMV